MIHFKKNTLALFMLAAGAASFSSRAEAANSMTQVCKTPSTKIAEWKIQDWNYCRAAVKRACVNHMPYADAQCAKRIQEQTPECHEFSAMLNQLNTSADLVEWKNIFSLTVISQYFPGDGGENYVFITPFCEINLMDVDLSQYDKAATKTSLIEYKKPFIAKKNKNIQARAQYKVKSCKACAVTKSGTIIFNFDEKGELKSVEKK